MDSVHRVLPHRQQTHRLLIPHWSRQQIPRWNPRSFHQLHRHFEVPYGARFALHLPHPAGRLVASAKHLLFLADGAAVLAASKRLTVSRESACPPHAEPAQEYIVQDLQRELRLGPTELLKLRKAVYGLVNAPKEWYKRLRRELAEQPPTSALFDHYS